MTNTTRRWSTPASRNSATRPAAASPAQLTDDQFKPLRLKNGLYLQLHAYMLRVAIPYGTLNSRADAQAGATSRASMIAATAISPRGRTSSTTGSSWRRRPTSSPSWPRSRCTRSRPAANCIRNISADQYAGAAADEIIDPRPWAELIRQMVDLPSRVQLSAAQVQDRGDRRRRPTARRCAARHRHADRQERRGRDRLRGLRRRRHGPHPDHRPLIRDFVPDGPDLLSYSAGVPARLEPLRRGATTTTRRG